MQHSLFDASEYVRKAYDHLVLAYSAAELEQIASLKAQTIRTYVALQEMRIGVEMPDEQETLDVVF